MSEEMYSKTVYIKARMLDESRGSERVLWTPFKDIQLQKKEKTIVVGFLYRVVLK